MSLYQRIKHKGEEFAQEVNGYLREADKNIVLHGNIYPSVRQSLGELRDTSSHFLADSDAATVSPSVCFSVCQSVLPIKTRAPPCGRNPEHSVKPS